MKRLACLTEYHYFYQMHVVIYACYVQGQPPLKSMASLFQSLQIVVFNQYIAYFEF